jgi:signal transduction histidine kinase
MSPDSAPLTEPTARLRHCAANRRKSKALRLSRDDREQLRQALHDGLGQLLTSLSFAAASLREKLTAKQLPEAAEAEEIVALTREAISEAQGLVRDESPPARTGEG